MSGQVKSVEAVIAEELIADAWNYTKGIPPRITYARIYLLDSRSVTFRIIDSHDHVSFVTVIEISHWLPSCHHGGVDRKDIAESLWQEYPEIVESDVLVLCLDNQKLLYTPSDIVQNDEDLRRRERLLADIDHIQRVCQEYRGDRYYIPVLRIYTKCRELEYPEEYQKEVLPPYVKSQAFTSLLAEEQWAVTRNPTRSIIERMYQNAGNLSKGYSAAMRCSAYGHDNSGWWSSEKNGYEPHPPQPKNIHLLMQWLLTATGCIPVELEGVQCRAGRRQFRAENPAIDGDDFREEALLRQYLFENVGAFDVEVTRADSVLKRLMLRARMNRNPNGNHN